MPQPKSPLAKRLTVAVQAHEESIVNKSPASMHLAKRELQAICDEIDAISETEPPKPTQEAP